MIAEEKKFTEIAINDTLAGTQERKEFRFNINLKASETKGKNQIERVLKQGYEIQDIPGGWIKKDNVPEDKKEKFEDFLKDSTILYIPIDAPVLMEPSSDEEKKVSGSLLEIEHVRDIVFSWVEYNKNRDRKCSLFFIPIKCEYYLKNDSTANQLRQKVIGKDGKYDEICEKVQKSGFVDVYYLPVQTLGCVEFSDGNWSLKEGNKYFYAHFITRGGSWKRKNIDKLAADIFKHSAWAIKDGIDEKQKLLENAGFIEKLTNANLKNYKKELKVIEGALKPMIGTFENTYDKDLTESYRV